jgi:hypothetical protein
LVHKGLANDNEHYSGESFAQEWSSCPSPAGYPTREEINFPEPQEEEQNNCNITTENIFERDDRFEEGNEYFPELSVSPSVSSDENSPFSWTYELPERAPNPLGSKRSFMDEEEEAPILTHKNIFGIVEPEEEELLEESFFEQGTNSEGIQGVQALLLLRLQTLGVGLWEQQQQQQQLNRERERSTRRQLRRHCKTIGRGPTEGGNHHPSSFVPIVKMRPRRRARSVSAPVSKLL